MSRRPFRIGTRQSTLALRQTQMVCDLLGSARPDVEVAIVQYESSGDKMLEVPAPQLALDAFTDSIETALAAGEIDAAVHSYKDLPPDSTPGLIVAAVPLRADPREALVCAQPRKLRELKSGAVVGTSSERRAAAVLALRPDLRVRPIRGAVDARVAMVLAGQYDAALLALAGLRRLDLLEHITEIFDLATMPPAAGQGALAVQCRADDAFALAVLADIDDIELHNVVDAEMATSRRALAK
ncbi:MAG: hydroxymethylbilane synthase [Gemmatimonadaceae bacterium]